ncbi:MAG: hypothetical protein ABEN55_07895, partial [Bradymonadaceae bacterium]
PPTDEQSPETPEQSPDKSADGDAPSPDAAADVRLRTFVVERGDSKVTVLHAPHRKDRAVAAFRTAVETLRGPDAIPAPSDRGQKPPDADKSADGEQSRYASWTRDWSPDRLEIEELSLPSPDRALIRGTAASDKDVDEFVRRLNSLEAFSAITIASTGSVEDGQGITYRVEGKYRADGDQN